MIMKTILVSLLVLSTSLLASSIKWHGNYTQALQTAKKQNKNIILYLQEKDCLDCKKMLQTTLYNQNYIKKINDSYISIIVQRENKISYPIELFYTLTYPTVFFINTKDESFLMNPIYGYVSSSKFREHFLSIDKKGNNITK